MTAIGEGGVDNLAHIWSPLNSKSNRCLNQTSGCLRSQSATLAPRNETVVETETLVPYPEILLVMGFERLFSYMCVFFSEKRAGWQPRPNSCVGRSDFRRPVDQKLPSPCWMWPCKIQHDTPTWSCCFYLGVHSNVLVVWAAACLRFLATFGKLNGLSLADPRQTKQKFRFRFTCGLLNVSSMLHLGGVWGNSTSPPPPPKPRDEPNFKPMS